MQKCTNLVDAELERILQFEHVLPRIGFDAAENDPSEVIITYNNEKRIFWKITSSITPNL